MLEDDESIYHIIVLQTYLSHIFTFGFIILLIITFIQYRRKKDLH